MKTALLFTALAFTLPAQADTVKRCTGKHHAVYTDAPDSACPNADLSDAPVLSLNRPSEKNEPKAKSKRGKQAEKQEGKKTEKTAEKARLKAEREQAKALKKAEKKWQNAEAALERGKAMRKGGEKNFARYRERVRGLEEKAAQAKQEFEALQKQ
ncbi:MAG: hypothetical protein Q4D82_06675 [Neisseria sp.]|nr:hypothetical protein [Neisseria sp.]